MLAPCHDLGVTRYRLHASDPKFHHAATGMAMLNGLRDHPLERAMVHGFNAVPTAMLGVLPEHYLAAQLWLQTLGFLKRGNFDSNWASAGR
jgi:hypothetical protein